LPGAGALHRWCDAATATRPAGAPPFWTLGANQSGKAGLSAWREWLAPALAAEAPIDLWPYAGPPQEQLRPGRLAVAEVSSAAAPPSAARQQARRGRAPDPGSAAARGQGTPARDALSRADGSDPGRFRRGCGGRGPAGLHAGPARARRRARRPPRRLRPRGRG